MLNDNNLLQSPKCTIKVTIVEAIQDYEFIIDHNCYLNTFLLIKNAALFTL